MHTIRKILKAAIILIIILWATFFGIILYAIISDYRPEPEINLIKSETPGKIDEGNPITIMSWNIGYAGLDDEMDFFYDGGTKVRPSQEQYNENIGSIAGFLRDNDSLDFIFLQEVDRKSRRSYKNDQYEKFQTSLPGKSSQFAVNYDVFFVPVPPSNPMGKVLSGISVFGDVEPESSTRYSFPGKYSFPKQLFMLDRCFIANRYPLENGKELVLINTHNEAFDTGDIRKAQMDFLRDFLITEYNKGNYIIAGGDWNQSPAGFIPQFNGNVVNTNQMMLEKGFLPEDWTWAYDNKKPSNRTVTGPYRPKVTATTVIDFFLLSPNVETVSVKCKNLEFENSDHNPVFLVARLRRDGRTED